MNNIPDFVTKYLWDVPATKVSIKSHPEFVIERVLEYGDSKALDWLNNAFEKNVIIGVIKKSRRISPKTGNFYGLYYGIDRKDILCIQKPFIQKQNRF